VENYRAKESVFPVSGNSRHASSDRTLIKTDANGVSWRHCEFGQLVSRYTFASEAIFTALHICVRLLLSRIHNKFEQVTIPTAAGHFLFIIPG